MCDKFTLHTLRLKTRRFKSSPLSVTLTESEIQTTTAGRLWGAYLGTIAHFYKELANQKLAELRTIKSVNQSSNLSFRKLTCVTLSRFTRFV